MKARRAGRERRAGGPLAAVGRQLAQVLQAPAQQQQEAAAPVTMRQGVIVTCAPDPVTITLGGSPTAVPAPRLAEGYFPSIGDVVMVLQFDGDLLILGTRAFI